MRTLQNGSTAIVIPADAIRPGMTLATGIMPDGTSVSFVGRDRFTVLSAYSLDAHTIRIVVEDSFEPVPDGRPIPSGSLPVHSGRSFITVDLSPGDSVIRVVGVEEPL